MYRLALNMLFGDRAKLAMLLCGLAFSALLMAQQSSVFFGIMSWTYTPMVNIRAQVWVSDPMVEQVNDAKPLRDTDLGRVRSVDGVAWAAPLHTSFVQARMQDGNFKLITLVGIDADTFAEVATRWVAPVLTDVAVDSARGRVYVARPFGSAVTVLDAGTLAEVSTIAAPFGVRELDIEPESGRIVAGSFFAVSAIGFRGGIVNLEGGSRLLQASTTLAATSSPHSMAICKTTRWTSLAWWLACSTRTWTWWRAGGATAKTPW